MGSLTTADILALPPTNPLRRALERANAGRTVPQAPKPSKYRNVPVVVDGIRFDSNREAQRYEVLKVERAAGNVLWFARQVSFDLPGNVRYRADFVVVWEDGRVTVEDVKGVRTAVYAMKRKQMKAVHGIDIQEV